MTVEETDALFDHTRRLREDGPKPYIEDLCCRGEKKRYAFVRKTDTQARLNTDKEPKKVLRLW